MDLRHDESESLATATGSHTAQSVTAQATAPAPSPAHPAFPSISSSSSRPQPVTFSNSQDIISLISPTDSIDFVRNILVPSLQHLVSGKTFEGAGLNPAERKSMAEKMLACENTDLYTLQDAGMSRMSAGLVYIVSARLNTYKNSPAGKELLDFAYRLCRLCDGQQMAFVQPRVSMLAWGILRLAQELAQVPVAVQAIESLIRKACTDGRFAGAYAAYLEACLTTKELERAKLVLDQVFLNIKTCEPSYLDVLTYYHHAGLVSAALGEFSKAKQYFVTAVSLPTTTPSAIQLAAAKRAVLCEILDTGKRIVWPKYTSQTVTRAIEKNMGVYLDMARDYEGGNWVAVREMLKKADFTQDCNGGLRDQVLTSITKRRILQLRATYSRMTINDLVARVGPSSQETVETVATILGEMIATGSIDATITAGSTPATSVVTFNVARSQYTGASAIKELTDISALAARLEADLTEASRQLGISKEYLKKNEQQANYLEVGGGKGASGKGKMDDFDQLMAAEEMGTRSKGPGGNYADMGF
ncbi:hypothetical protein IAU60_001037 [Kwoniella sp. DSM 27419]